MRVREYITRFLTLALVLAGCNESLEDTYDEYTDGGRIRYVGKCYDAKVVPGWKSLTVNWTRAIDETAKNIKVVCSLNDTKDTVLLEPNVVSFKKDQLIDGTYRFDISVIDNSGNESLVEEVYGRPYTENHEIVLSFTNVITKSWPIGSKNALLCRLDRWNENIVSAQLKYIKASTGEPDTVVLKKEYFTSGKLYQLEDVSLKNTDTVYILRRGFLENCPDTVDFNPISVNKNRMFTTDFLQVIHDKFGISYEKDEEKFNEFIDTVEELEFDYDMTSFEDILHCPNLRKIILGKNRYVVETKDLPAPKSVLEEVDKSVEILMKAHEFKGVTIERYAKHYFADSVKMNFMEEKGLPVLPALTYVQKSEIDSITCSVSLTDSEKATFNFLLDDDPSTYWKTTNVGTLRSYEVIIHLKDEMDIRGVKVAQPKYTWWDGETPKFMTSYFQVKTSIDQVDWYDVSYVENNEIGKGSEECVLIYLPENATRRAKYVKVILNDQADQGAFRLMLGDIVVFK